jgi:hypothetical protein
LIYFSAPITLCRVYYQLSKQITVPTFCQDIELTPSEFFDKCFTNHEDGSNDLLTQWEALQEECTTSYTKICTAVFTDNPPFACTYEAQPSALSVFSNAFAGTEFIYVLFSTGIMLIITFWPMIKSWIGDKYEQAGDHLDALRQGSFRGDAAVAPTADEAAMGAAGVAVDDGGYAALPVNSPIASAASAAKKYEPVDVVQDF